MNAAWTERSGSMNTKNGGGQPAKEHLEHGANNAVSSEQCVITQTETILGNDDSTNIITHPLIPSEVDFQLAVLNSNMRFPTGEQLTREQVQEIVKQCDKAFQFFQVIKARGVYLECNEQHIYYVWRMPR
jgi:hypothetical protein